jgi:octaprenyl-diphosphate synthase
MPFRSTVIPLAILNSVKKLNFDLQGWDGNDRIGKVLSRTVLTGGKRLRPLLTFVMGDFFDISHDTIAPYGRAVELVHASTLAHDDVIDNATSRRGEPSINEVSSNKRAVLAGDYLLAFVLADVSKRGRNDIVVELANVIADLAEGEWIQLENIDKASVAREDVDLVALKKTGSVLRWCCAVPALLANSSEEVVQLAKQFGEKLGVAFQMTDDVLDFLRKDEAAFADLKNGVINSVIYELGKISPNFRDAPLSEIEGPVDEAIGLVRRRAETIMNEARSHLQKIVDLRGPMSSKQEKAHKTLEYLCEFILTRT